jgi:hypothetical protein
MGFVHIAFIECVLDGAWHETGEHGDRSKFAHGWYETSTDNAKISLVDLGSTRRYYSFRTNSIVSIMNNVLIFRDDHGTLELSVDDSKKFPDKTKIDD